MGGEAKNKRDIDVQFWFIILFALYVFSTNTFTYLVYRNLIFESFAKPIFLVIISNHNCYLSCTNTPPASWCTPSLYFLIGSAHQICLLIYSHLIECYQPSVWLWVEASFSELDLIHFKVTVADKNSSPLKADDCSFIIKGWCFAFVHSHSYLPIYWAIVQLD